MISVTRAPLIQPDDNNLIGLLIGGEAQAFDQLVALYQQRVTRLARRLLPNGSDVDDVVQDVFLAVFEKSRSFRGDCSIWSWLTTITVNQCRSRQRRLWLFHRMRWRLVRSEIEPATDSAAIDETSRRVRSAVEKLASRDREVIVLHYLEGHRASDIAIMLGATTNTIEVRLHRARRKLKAALADIAQDLEHE
jgi:RNA polymerase sigma factor (sigma-70 family)